MKEALFNILGNEVLDIQILDLFGGTGAVGIEALSRGAVAATFLETNWASCKDYSVKIWKPLTLAIKLWYYIRTPSNSSHLPNLKSFDLIYIAPPQYKAMWQKAMLLVDQNPKLLSDNGQIIVQINPLEWVDEHYVCILMSSTGASMAIRCLSFSKSLNLQKTSPTDCQHHIDITPKMTAIQPESG